jgi:hypothetical protein
MFALMNRSCMSPGADNAPADALGPRGLASLDYA